MRKILNADYRGGKYKAQPKSRKKNQIINWPKICYKLLGHITEYKIMRQILTIRYWAIRTSRYRHLPYVFSDSGNPAEKVPDLMTYITMSYEH